MPVLLKRIAAKEDREKNSDPSRPDENKPSIYAVLKAQAILQLPSAVV